MAATTVTRMIEKQDEILKQLQGQIEAARAGRAPARGENVLAGKTAMLSSLNERLKRAKEARQAELDRLDAEIASLEARTKSLEAEVRADREHIELATKGSAARSTADQSGLTRITGIGKVTAERLKEHGIGDIEAVGRMEPAELSKLLGISDKRAREIIASAKGRSR
jgi:predicted flap endonuclease-1-like 5' DNA nuclease